MVLTTRNQIPSRANTRTNEEEIDRLTEDIAKDLIVQIQWGLTEDDINFTGDTSDSIIIDEERGSRTIIIDTPYAGFIEYGLPGGGGVGNININIDQLRSWVFHKLGITDEEENLAVTYKIAKKIQTKGIRPKRFVKKAIKRLISGRSVPNKPRAKRAKSGFFEKLKKKFKKLKILKKLKKTSKKIKKLINKADKTYKKLRRYK